MASLFGSLPAPAGNKRAVDESDLDCLSESPKRVRTAADTVDAREPREEARPTTTASPVAPVASLAASGATADELEAALQRISVHIAHPRKFVRASELLRKLLAEGALQPSHSSLVFTVLCASMADPRRAADPPLAREYSRLFSVAASRLKDAFTREQRAQLDVYGLWAVLRTELATTDESFAFNKVVGKVKGLIGELPEAGPEDDAPLQALGLLPAGVGELGETLPASSTQRQQQQQQQQEEGAAEPRQPPGAVQAPSLPPEPAQGPGQPAGTAPQPWSEQQCLAARRAALLDCVLAGREVYRHAWASTTVDLLVDHASQHAVRFAPCQRGAIEGMVQFVRGKKAARRLGPSAKESARDVTSFDRARAEWGRATISTKKHVGAIGGDHKAEQWLG